MLGAGRGSLGSLGGGPFNIASGTIGPNDLAAGGVTSGNIASGSIGHFAIAANAIQSGQIASGAVMGSLGGGPFEIASGTIGTNDIGNGAVVSGSIGSGQVGHFHVATNTIQSGQVGSGAILGSLGGGPFEIASGTIGPNDLAANAVQSGNIASGAVITYAHNVTTESFTCTEIVSGVCCVTFDPAGSGAVRIAMASVSGRMPAIGVVFENVASGSLCKVIKYGNVMPPSNAMGSGVCISGRIGKSLWVGSSGQLVVLSGGGPTIGVGATNSGAWGQRMGNSSTSGAVLIDIVPFMQYSGQANTTTNFQQWPV